jgi:cyclohexyl-isocyanide hydratase
MKIVELTEADAAAYKTFFLSGLTQHGDCFRISPRDEAGEPFPTRGQPDSFTLASISDADEWMGVVSFEREGLTREKLRHKGLLFRMYVSHKHGGKGVGQYLVEEVIARTKRLPNLEQINLTVVASNQRAKSLYTRLGFVTFSLEKNAIKFENQYLDEEQMVLRLKD